MRDELLTRMGEVRDAIEVARAELDPVTLAKLVDEREEIREHLLRLQRPSRADLMRELEAAKAHLAGLGFKPASGMLLGMAGGGGPQGGMVSGDGIVAARRAQKQGKADSGAAALEARIIKLEAKLAER